MPSIAFGVLNEENTKGALGKSDFKFKGPFKIVVDDMFKYIYLTFVRIVCIILDKV